jgi:hypothetical protein
LKDLEISVFSKDTDTLPSPTKKAQDNAPSIYRAYQEEIEEFAKEGIYVTFIQGSQKDLSTLSTEYQTLERR